MVLSDRVGTLFLERIVRGLWFAALIVVVSATLARGSNLPVGVSVNDKLLHFIAYFGLGVIGGVGWPNYRLALLVAMPLLGLSLEGIQGGFVAGRQFDRIDAAANAVGAFAGVAASVIVRRFLFKVS